MIFFCYYYPVGLYNNAVPTDAVNERAALFMLILQNFLLFVSRSSCCQAVPHCSHCLIL